MALIPKIGDKLFTIYIQKLRKNRGGHINTLGGGMETLSRYHPDMPLSVRSSRFKLLPVLIKGSGIFAGFAARSEEQSSPRSHPCLRGPQSSWGRGLAGAYFLPTARSPKGWSTIFRTPRLDEFGGDVSSLLRGPLEPKLALLQLRPINPGLESSRSRCSTRYIWGQPRKTGATHITIARWSFRVRF